MPPRTDRRERAADAAIEIIAEQGLRGLTHRACDARAGLPLGSTSSCFRTRAALVGGVLERIVAQDEELLVEYPTENWTMSTPEGRENIVVTLTELMSFWLGPGRTRTLARLELFVDAARREELDDELAAANRQYLRRVTDGMVEADMDNPEEAARLLIAQMDGLFYDAIVRPHLGGGEPERLRAAIAVIIEGLAHGLARQDG